MAAVSTAIQREVIQPSGNHLIFLSGVSWATYKQLDEERGEQAGTRLTFSEGTLQIMAVGREHERLNYYLARLFDLLAETFDRDFVPAGSTTFDRDDLEKGFQPDSCFYLTNVEAMRDKKEIDLATDPPPDLLLEIDITSSSLNRLPLFAAAGVPEVWRYKNGAIKIYRLHSGIYDESLTSQWFPTVNVEQLADWLKSSRTMPHFKWLRTIRNELQAGKP
ncbi:MAG: Uma2 family endonuclease [Acidobacteria bacterium]|nr:Uma2 family endonuclease [Acidobacteriota bacterium]